MRFLSLSIVFALFLLAATTPVDAANGRWHRLWGGQASIEVGKKARISKSGANRYVVRTVGSDVQVLVDRGSIPSKYRGASTGKIGRAARDRLRRQGYKIESFAVSGQAVRIVFSGVRTVTVRTAQGPLQVRVPWRGWLRWLRQANDRTYQSLVSVPQPERASKSASLMLRSARSLRIPPMRKSARDRLDTAVASVPLLTQKVGSWVPAWSVR